MKWEYKGKTATPGAFKKPGYVLDDTFKKWLNYILPKIIGKDVVVTIEKPVKLRKKAAKKRG